jgi:hypothetical protein
MAHAESAKCLLALAYCKKADFVISSVTMSRRKTIDADAPETEISPEMIEAGAEIIWTYFYDAVAPGSESARDAAIAVYQAMVGRREKA